MATAGWRENSTLKTLVFEHHGRFNVFQLMRLLLWRRAGTVPDAALARVPAEARVEQRLRFTADLSAAFPGREISRLRMRAPEQNPFGSTPGPSSESDHVAGAGVVEISTPNFCVAGALGPLPEPFTEWVRDLGRAREPAMEDFLNIFNQRMNVLRLHLKTRQTPGLNNAPPEDTAQARYLAALMGMAQRDLGAQVPLPRRAWLGLAGLLANTRRSPFVLTHVLSQFVGAKVSLEQLVGAWQIIEPDNRIALGAANHRLGQQSVLGRRVWDQQARIRITLAPLAYEDFCELLPPNKAEQRTLRRSPSDDRKATAFENFVALLRLLLDRQCDCEVSLEAEAATVPPRVLGAAPSPINAHRGLRLGQTAWLADGGGVSRPHSYKAGYLVRAFETVEAA